MTATMTQDSAPGAPSTHPAAMPGADPRQERTRLGVIDSFRGIAILSVVAFHFTVALTPPLISPDHYHYARHFPMWLEAGRYGVQVFFIPRLPDDPKIAWVDDVEGVGHGIAEVAPSIR
jgi:hypothetical protein